MPDGVIRQWLILGPVPSPQENPAQQDVLPGEAELAPEEGQKTGQWVWKTITVDTSWLDFAALLGKHKDALAYACTYIYSPTGGTFRLNLSYVGNVRICVNGKASKPIGTRFQLDLTKGWNRLLLRVSSGEQDWFVVPVLHGWGGGSYRQTNIAWRTPLPGVMPAYYGGGMGVGAPVIAGDRLYVQSEPHDLICIRKTDGKVLWMRRSSYFEAASDEERLQSAFKDAESLAAKIDAINSAFVAGGASSKQLEEKAQLEKALHGAMRRADAKKYAIEPSPDVGFSGFTPVTDGRFIYTWSASGVSTCYDLDGIRKWIRIDRRPAVEHGFSSSPLLVDAKLVVFMRDLSAFDAGTGQLAWRVPLVSLEGFNPGGFFHGSPVAASIDGVHVIALGDGTIVRASDGKTLYSPRDTGSLCVASPVAEPNRLFHVTSSSMALFTYNLPDKFTEPLQVRVSKLALDTAAFPKHYLPWHLASPLIHEGLAYLVNNSGVLTVVDVEAGTVVYQKLLDLDPFLGHNEGAARGIGISPALAGGHLYFLGNNGAALVVEPGRVYRQIAKNKLEIAVMVGHWSERQERFVANPVFDGRRLYLRGEGSMYAIGPR